MSWIQHLEELRKRLIICVIFVSVAAVVSYMYIDFIRDLFSRPVDKLFYLTLTEAFLTNIRLALISAVFLSLPVIFYQVWCFILPALHQKERRLTLLISALSLFFFMLGALFAFLVVMPFTIRFFLGFSSDQLEPMLSFSSYISYTLGLVIGFGLVFEMPVAVMILTRLGVISAGFLAANRMYAAAVIFVAAAIFTPPDVISQLMMAIPMLGLYEVSILFARVVSRNKQPLSDE
ncbi:twin-arginine translocase subunit TatC [Dethiobacter alkaliphilus]|uniref:twin-arginine translocase subunit TatC n=1 Tax=Dethiobacter alkaliphilus TaxID=427926 RepID=UPI002226306B|nr:twin-arginine translocase subunit TatC [Dethiobacter alkaliphilus]MCW3488521.1 twin-arginine translocase subunit TatC [Dethiobacter alkaliphilus]